jgi:hypothetical protein
MANLHSSRHHLSVHIFLSAEYQRARYLLQQMDDSFNRNLRGIKSLTLDMGGLKGTHGKIHEHHTSICSAGMVSHWRSLLTCMSSLTHLDIRFDRSSEGVDWAEGPSTDKKGRILDWLLSTRDIVFEHVTHLCFYGFLINRDTLCTPKVFASREQWPSLKHLTLDEIRLMWNQEPVGVDTDQVHLDHLQGDSWLRVCQHITDTLPGIEIEVHRPVSNINDDNDFKIHQKYNDILSQMLNVNVEVQGLYLGGSLPPITEYQVHTTGDSSTTPANEILTSTNGDTTTNM